jgi:hypothetical protein
MADALKPIPAKPKPGPQRRLQKPSRAWTDDDKPEDGWPPTSDQLSVYQQGVGTYTSWPNTSLISLLNAAAPLPGDYPVAGGECDGRAVGEDVPNTDSISASLTDYKVLKGIREVPLKDVITDPKGYFYAADDMQRSRDLAAEIKASKEIAPIIVVIDNQGPYVLEGAHRVVALFMLKAQAVPALVVLDLESLGIEAKLNFDSEESARFWIDPKGKVHSTEGLAHVEWLIQNGFAEARRDKSDGSLERSFVTDKGWARIGVSDGGYTLYVMVKSPADVLPALKRIAIAEPEAVLVKNLVIDDGTENFEENEIPVDEGEDAVKAYRQRNRPGKRIKAGLEVQADSFDELIDNPDIRFWILSDKSLFIIPEGSYHTDVLDEILPEEYQKLWDQMRAGDPDNSDAREMTLELESIAQSRGMVRGWVQRRRALGIGADDDKMPEYLKAVEKWNPEWVLVERVFSDKTEVPVAYGEEDALQAWQRRKSPRKLKAKLQVLAGETRLWIKPNGEVIDWEVVDLTDDERIHHVNKLKELGMPEDLEDAMSKGWVRAVVTQGRYKKAGRTLFLYTQESKVEWALDILSTLYPDVTHVVVEPRGDDAGEGYEVEALEGEDILKAWRHRHDARHRVAAADQLQFFRNDAQNAALAHEETTDAATLDQLGYEQYDLVRIRVANNPNTSPETLARLAGDRDLDVRMATARNLGTPAKALAALAGDEEEHVRTVAAINPGTPGKTLMALTKDKSEDVRNNVARNRAAPPEVLKRLLRDKDHHVVLSVASNTSAPEEILMALAKHGAFDVLLSVADNENATPAVLDALANGKGSWSGGTYIIENVASNPKASPELLNKLVKSRVASIRMRVAENTTATAEMLTTLAADPNKKVRYFVAMNANTPQAVVFNLAEDEDSSVSKAATERLPVEERVRRTSKPPEGFSKEVSRTVDPKRYALRRLEQAMTQAGDTQVRKADLNKAAYQRLQNDATIAELMKANNNVITLAQVQTAMGEKKAKGIPYYVHHGEYPGKEAQSDEAWRKLPRHTYALGFKDLPLSEESKAFFEDIAPKLKHSEHTIGVGGKNLGWILWKDISELMGEPSVVIEQVQSDWRGLTEKLRDIAKANPEQATQVKEFEDKYGGPAVLDKIQKEMDEMVATYPEQLVSSFLEEIPGWKVYMTGREQIIKLTSMSPKVATEIYQDVAKRFGFTKSEKWPGYLMTTASYTAGNYITASQGEVFRYGLWRFDVGDAEIMAEDLPAETKTPDKSWVPGFVKIDDATVAKADLTKPVILARIFVDGRIYSILIDGNHRVTKALAEGKPVLAKTLSVESTFKIMSGPGVDKMKAAYAKAVKGQTVVAAYQGWGCKFWLTPEGKLEAVNLDKTQHAEHFKPVKGKEPGDVSRSMIAKGWTRITYEAQWLSIDVGAGKTIEWVLEQLPDHFSQAIHLSFRTAEHDERGFELVDGESLVDSYRQAKRREHLVKAATHFNREAFDRDIDRANYLCITPVMELNDADIADLKAFTAFYYRGKKHGSTPRVGNLALKGLQVMLREGLEEYELGLLQQEAEAREGREPIEAAYSLESDLGPWMVERYKGYAIWREPIEGTGGQYGLYPKDEQGNRAFEDIPVSVAVARKWIDQDIAEREAFREARKKTGQYARPAPKHADEEINKFWEKKKATGGSTKAPIPEVPSPGEIINQPQHPDVKINSALMSIVAGMAEMKARPPELYYRVENLPGGDILPNDTPERYAELEKGLQELLDTHGGSLEPDEVELMTKHVQQCRDRLKEVQVAAMMEDFHSDLPGDLKFWIDPKGVWHDNYDGEWGMHSEFFEGYNAARDKKSRGKLTDDILDTYIGEGWSRGTVDEDILYLELGNGKTAAEVLPSIPETYAEGVTTMVIDNDEFAVAADGLLKSYLRETARENT